MVTRKRPQVGSPDTWPVMGEEEEKAFRELIQPPDFDEVFEGWWEKHAEECFDECCCLDGGDGFFINTEVEGVRDAFQNYCRRFIREDYPTESTFTAMVEEWKGSDGYEVVNKDRLFERVFPGIEVDVASPILLIVGPSASAMFDYRSKADNARWFRKSDSVNGFLWYKVEDLMDPCGRIYLNDIYSHFAVRTMDDVFDAIGDVSFDVSVELSRRKYGQFPYGLAKGVLSRRPIRIGSVDDLFALYAQESDDNTDLRRDSLLSAGYDFASYGYEHYIDFIAFKLSSFCARYRYRTEEQLDAWDDAHRFFRSSTRVR